MQPDISPKKPLASDHIPATPAISDPSKKRAFRCEDRSMDRAGFQIGDYAVWIESSLARFEIGDGDIVVLRQPKTMGSELQIRRLKLAENGFELWPESTDPQFRKPIRVPLNNGGRKGDRQSPKILGRVIGRWTGMELDQSIALTPLPSLQHESR